MPLLQAIGRQLQCWMTQADACCQAPALSVVLRALLWRLRLTRERVLREGGSEQQAGRGQHARGTRGAEEVQHEGDQPRPAGLVTGADAGAIVAVKVFIEEQAVPPMGVGLEERCPAEHRAAA